MSKPEYTIRNYVPADFDGVARLFIEQSRISGRLESNQELAEKLNRPGFSAEKDLFIAETEGNIIGYAHLTPEKEIDRVHLRGWIEPSHRRKGLAASFLPYVIRRTEELGINAVQVGISQDNQPARNLLPKLGFKYVRRYLELTLDMDKIPEKDLITAAKGCRQLHPGEEETLTELQNRAFDRHWGYNPNTIEMITYEINLGNRSPGNVIFTCEEDRITGYCWTEIVTTITESGEEEKGVINMIGTDPDYRGRGLGKKALLAGLLYLRRKGIRTATLSVDSENKVAQELYRSVGFEQYGSTLWYEKRLS